MYILVANDLDLTISLHYADDFELSSFNAYQSFEDYIEAMELFLNDILD